MDREIAKDPWEKRLKHISEDSSIRGGLPAWVIRSHDIQTNYLDEKTNKPTQNYGTIVVKSMWWPGSYTFYNNSRVQMIYSGDGQKHELPEVTYYPILPPTMMMESDEKPCCEEPNPTEEWLMKKEIADAKAAAEK